MKISTIKTKKLSNIIYNQGYICINGNYIISASIADWLTRNVEYDSVIDVLNSGDNNAIDELIAYCQ